MLETIVHDILDWILATSGDKTPLNRDAVVTKFGQVLVSPLTGMWENGIRRQPWAHQKEPSRKVLDKHAKFLSAWGAAGFPDKFQYEGTSLNNVQHPAEATSRSRIALPSTNL